MSKKSQKKTSKTASGSSNAQNKAPKKRAQTNTRPAKTRASPARKSSTSATAPASHKPASKRLKSSESPTAKPILTEGQKAPAFRLPRDGGGTAALSDYAGKRLVLFFYPRAHTPGCTREAIDFTRLSGDFMQNDIAVVGISADPPKAQEKFRDKHQLTVPLLSDEKHRMLEAYGAWGEKSMYGKKFLGILRTTVLIGADGKVARIWRNVRVDGHAEDVLAAARTL